ncbi:Uncharacterized protein conserved in bacteria [Klebsiella pneumoniae]|uniref:Uncharacterized protein conserved in bacteria n=1 Tax=Klebsiella pneumoniae TaxID=573 RepID=A0A2X3EUH3_KLEPN|nr:Uncharacterized protein conserved in bacteria [Klebsiella pneumoniae]
MLYPAPKRQYGYFVLPLLHQGKLVGRMDSKIHRKSRELEIFALWLEEGVKITPWSGAGAAPGD